MKHLLSFLLFLLPIISTAQNNIQYSEPFDEPNSFRQLLYILDNGNTVFLRMSEDEGIQVDIYDTEHKKIKSAVSENSQWTDRKLSASTLRSSFEANGDIVLFITQLHRKNMLKLHRIIISTETGKITKAEELDEIPTRRAWGYDLEVNTSLYISNDYYVSKDLVSGKYAIVTFEGYTKDKTDKVKLSVYDTDHKLISETYLSKEINTAELTHFGEVYMHDNIVYICTNDYNRKSKSMNTPIYLSKYDVAENKLETKKLSLTPVSITSTNSIVYDPKTKKLVLLTTTLTDHDTKSSFGVYTTMDKFASILTYLDPNSLDILYSDRVRTPKTNKFAKDNLGMKNGFDVIKPSISINNNNRVVLQDSKNVSSVQNKGSGPYGNKLAVIFLKDNGIEDDVYIVQSSGYPQYLSTKNGNYIISNEVPSSFNKEQDEKQEGGFTLSDRSALLYKLSPNGIKMILLFH
ncbi:MAG: hypothetical protein KDC11_05520 [Chitinophagaceae bacterium]|nr:hypothetical protein [Chitinophagaceae bacterium]